MTKNLKITLAIAVAAVIGFGGLLAWTNTGPSTASPGGPASTTAPADVLVRPDSHRLSTAADGKVTVVEFLDFECEACKAMFPVIERLRAEYGDRVTFVVRYFPLPGHPNSGTAALAVEAAAQQGALEPMYRKMYENQDQWSHQQTSQAEKFTGYARELGLDLQRFQQAVNDPATVDRIERDMNDGAALGVEGTPTLFLNGQKLPSMPSYEQLKAQIDTALAQ
ncbi:thioredoxin domain-containing protein [Allosaccharopolyspora coralli]|uniref:Thioredoxin domain-containing protein n=1 Tax=Allosaccharopolyspora coralli TaxID=2665642 RepID=A0A5Q3Q7E3_9PSEU|nr:thioredoxin domain-containing protein [Allosaccharopolyspora coralli]QGK70263.1 thioredoxin domain-containing protein [Allosaccharopolyspora coralli]